MSQNAKIELLNLLSNLMVEDAALNDSRNATALNKLFIDFKKRLSLTQKDLEKLNLGENIPEKLFPTALIASLKELFQKISAELPSNISEMEKVNNFLNKNPEIIRDELFDSINKLELGNAVIEHDAANIEIRTDIKEYLDEVLSKKVQETIAVLKQNEDPISPESIAKIINLVQEINFALPLQVSKDEVRAACLEYLFAKADAPTTDLKFLQKLNQVNEAIFTRMETIRNSFGYREITQEESGRLNEAAALSKLYGLIYGILALPIQEYFNRNGMITGMGVLARHAKKQYEIQHAKKPQSKTEEERLQRIEKNKKVLASFDQLFKQIDELQAKVLAILLKGEAVAPKLRDELRDLTYDMGDTINALKALDVPEQAALGLIETNINILRGLKNPELEIKPEIEQTILYKNGILPGLLELAIKAKQHHLRLIEKAGEKNYTSLARFDEFISLLSSLLQDQTLLDAAQGSSDVFMQILTKKVEKLSEELAKVERVTNAGTLELLKFAIVNLKSVNIAEQLQQTLQSIRGQHQDKKEKRRIAYVEVYGTLILKDGSLNLSLVEELKQYDDIILFTQGSKFIQSANIQLLVNAEPIPEYVTTAQVIRGLQAQGILNIKVSTSVDNFFGNPTDYYNKNSLEQFEAQAYQFGLKAHASTKLSENENAAFKAEIAQESNDIRTKLRSPSNALAQDFYPKNKIAQYRDLVAFHRRTYGKGIEVSIYDGNEANLKDIVDSNAIADDVKPRAFLITKNTGAGSNIVEYFTTHSLIPEDFARNSMPNYAKLVAFFVEMKNQLGEEEEGRRRSKELKLNQMINLLLDKFKDPNKWNTMVALLDDLIRLDQAKQIRLPDPTLSLRDMQKALQGNPANNKSKRFIDAVKRDEARIHPNSVDTALRDIKRDTLGKWVEIKYRAPAVNAMKNVLQLVSQTNVDANFDAIEKALRDYFLIKEKIIKEGFEDNISAFQDDVMRYAVQESDITVYDFFKLKHLANLLFVKHEFNSAEYKRMEKEINDSEEQIQALEANIANALKQKEGNPKEAKLAFTIGYLESQKDELIGRLENQKQNIKKVLGQSTWYGQLSQLLKNKIGSEAERKILSDEGLSKDEIENLVDKAYLENKELIQPKKLFGYLLHNIPLAEIPKKIHEVFPEKTERDAINVEFYNYQLDNALHIHKWQMKLALEHELTPQKLEERKKYYLGIVEQPKPLIKDDPDNKYAKRFLPPLSKLAESKVQDEVKKKIAQTSEQICEQFILNLIELIKVTPWKAGKNIYIGGKAIMHFGGQLRPGIPNLLPTNVAAMYDLCLKAVESKETNWGHTFAHIAFIGMEAANNKPHSFLGMGKRDDLTQAFYDKFIKIWEEAKEMEAKHKPEGPLGRS